jgi:hypothetical protein
MLSLSRRRVSLLSAGLASCMVAAALFMTPALASRSHHPRTAGLTWAKVWALPQPELSRLQDSLIVLANEITPVAEERFAAVYAGIALDTPRHLVNLYLTRPGEAGPLLAAARRAHPGLDARLVHVIGARFTQRALLRGMARIMAAARRGVLPFTVYAVSELPGGAWLTVDVPDPAAAARLSALPLRRLRGRSVASLAGSAFGLRTASPGSLIHKPPSELRADACLPPDSVTIPGFL